MIYYAEFTILMTIDAYNKWKKFVEKSGIEAAYDLLNVDSENVFSNSFWFYRGSFQRYFLG